MARGGILPVGQQGVQPGFEHNTCIWVSPCGLGFLPALRPQGSLLSYQVTQGSKVSSPDTHRSCAAYTTFYMSEHVAGLPRFHSTSCGGGGRRGGWSAYCGSRLCKIQPVWLLFLLVQMVVTLAASAFSWALPGRWSPEPGLSSACRQPQSRKHFRVQSWERQQVRGDA